MPLGEPWPYVVYPFPTCAPNFPPSQLDRIEHKLDRLLQKEQQMALDLTQLTADVSADTDAVNSAVTLLGTLAAEITANANDPVALAALATSLEANTANLAAAVTANTPAAPAA